MINSKIDKIKKLYNPLVNRLQSASSTKTYLQCPRKYHFVYNLKLPQSNSIHLIRGKIMHTVKEEFFKSTEPDYKKTIINLLKSEWIKNKKELDDLNVDLVFYFEETLDMHFDWIDRFIKELEIKSKENNITMNEAFKLLTPQTEVEIIRNDIGLKCYIDTRIETPDGVDIGDYKSSKKDDAKEHKLQMGYYALAEYLETGKLPRMLVIDYFRHGKRYIEPNNQLIIYALDTLELLHTNTVSKDIKDYERVSSPLCKWKNAKGSGGCDFYDKCFV